jgi:hypothetical protein
MVVLLIDCLLETTSGMSCDVLFVVELMVSCALADGGACVGVLFGS